MNPLYKNYRLSIHQIEILQGSLLGDGHLTSNRKGKNSGFSYTSIHKEHIDYVYGEFNEYCSKMPKFTSYYDKRTCKTYNRYTFQTNVTEEFTTFHERWYINKIKIIPHDLILTKTVGLLWYLGDGHLSKFRNHIELCTDSFAVDQLENILIPQMGQFYARIRFANKRPRIIIPRSGVSKFLDFIGACPNMCFDYKWDTTSYDRDLRKTPTERYTPEQITNILNLYAEGNSYLKISNIIQKSSTSICRILKSKGVYVAKRDSTKYHNRNK